MGATLHCGAQASHCGGLSCCGAQALGMWASVVAAHGLSSCGTWVLGCTGSVVVAHGLIYSAVELLLSRKIRGGFQKIFKIKYIY